MLQRNLFSSVDSLKFWAYGRDGGRSFRVSIIFQPLSTVAFLTRVLQAAVGTAMAIHLRPEEARGWSQMVFGTSSDASDFQGSLAQRQGQTFYHYQFKKISVRMSDSCRCRRPHWSHRSGAVWWAALCSANLIPLWWAPHGGRGTRGCGWNVEWQRKNSGFLLNLPWSRGEMMTVGML